MFQSAICLYVGAICILAICSKANALDDYEVPPAIIKPLQPRGLQVSIPDHEGVTLFAFHGNVNEDFEHGREAGQMAVDVLRKRNGYWTYTNRVIRLKKGDVIYYWLYVIKDGLGYERLFQSFEVNEFYKEGEIILPAITTTAKPEHQTIPTTMITEIPTTINHPTMIPQIPIAPSTPPTPATTNIPPIPTNEVRPNPHTTNMLEPTTDDKIYFPTNPPIRKTTVVDNKEKEDTSCGKSITTVKEKKACKGDLIFSSDFSNGIGCNWTHEIHFNSDVSCHCKRSRCKSSTVILCPPSVWSILKFRSVINLQAMRGSSAYPGLNLEGGKPNAGSNPSSPSSYSSPFAKIFSSSYNIQLNI